MNFLLNKPSIDAALYLHIPFCQKLCYFCFCYTKIIKEKTNEVVINTLQNIQREINLYRNHFINSTTPKIRQLQIGGGTPTYLTNSQFSQMFSSLNEAFDLSELDEFSLEIDPRTVNSEDIAYLIYIGVNRISMGVQDFDPKVQEAINRVQPISMIEDLLNDIPDISLNFDLIYGLPHQTLQTFEITIDQCIQLGVDRLSVYSYDHTPEIYNHHKMMDPSVMPSTEEKIEMFLSTAEKLKNAGYQWVGVDHFAKKSDNLSIAQEKKQLGRTLNGYSTFREFDTEFGIGPSAISTLPTSYSQNIKSLDDYSSAISEGKFPVLRGWPMDDDDLKRRGVIMHIILYSYYPLNMFEILHGVTVFDYFENLNAKLQQLVQHGLIEISGDLLTATSLGRYYIYQIAKVFDKYTSTKDYYVRTHAAVKMLKQIR